MHYFFKCLEIHDLEHCDLRMKPLSISKVRSVQCTSKNSIQSYSILLAQEALGLK